jgi:two-component system, LytTR family, response regulator
MSTKTIKTVIIDDEKRSRDTLNGLINKFCPEIDVIGFADNYESSLVLIRTQKPQLVFLDIQLNDGNGFQILEQLRPVNFEVIFTTAYDQYAIKAIRYSALDYLLKPVIPDELIDSVKKAQKKINSGQTNESVHALLENLNSVNNESNKIVLSTSEGMFVFKIDDIIRCESDDYYTRFFFSNRRPLLISKTLKQNEELLGNQQFIRPHKSHLININYISQYVKTDGGYILLTDGTKIPVARRKREMISEFLVKL